MPAEKTFTQRSHRVTRAGRRLRRIHTPWVRLCFLSLLVFALSVGIVGLTLKAVKPYREAGAESARLALTRRQAAAVGARNDVLRRRIAYLKTPEGIAEEAHRLGYMRPGERPLVVLGLIAPAAAADDAPGTTPSGDASLFDRFQSHLRDL